MSSIQRAIQPGPSRTNPLSSAGEQSLRADLTANNHSLKPGHVVGFFPGLGSRRAYQNLDRSLLDSEIPDVVEIYREGALILGCPRQPEKLLLASEDLPKGRLERQGFIGAAILVHNLALESYLRAMANRGEVPISFRAYSGESYGIIASAMASGSVSVADGIKIGQIFTPLMMLAAGGEGLDELIGQKIAPYLPKYMKVKPLVPELYHVMSLKGSIEDLVDSLEAIGRSYPKTDVEVHKIYSREQANVYVRVGAKPSFDLFMRKFPLVKMAVLKEPTKFLAHSKQMHEVRHALERFMDKNKIDFKQPHTLVISNNDRGILTSAAEVRSAVLAITDEVMSSQATMEILDGLNPDVILELGLGNKSMQLFTDNNIQAPTLAFTGTSDETDLFLCAVKLLGGFTKNLEELRTSAGPLQNRHYKTLRNLFRLASESSFCDKYFYRAMGRTITNERLMNGKAGSSTFYQFLEIFQQTYNHRNTIDFGQGELVLQARLKKIIVGDTDRLGQVYSELKVIDETDTLSERCSINIKQSEVVVCHFDRLADLDFADLGCKTRLLLSTQPLAYQIYSHTLDCLQIKFDSFLRLIGFDMATVDQMATSYIVYQYTLFRLLHLYRPSIFAQSDYYLEGSDLMGWLVALAISGATSLATVVELHGTYLRAGVGSHEVKATLERMLSLLRNSDVPVISPDGVPLKFKMDLAAATRSVFAGHAFSDQVRRIHLNGNCQILSLGSVFSPNQVDAEPYHTDVISILAPTDIWRKGVNTALDEFENRSISTLTDENERVLRYAQSRRLLTSTVYAYGNIGEKIVDFGKGGSESMTIFLKKDGEERLTVRKILSDALTAVHWSPGGKGVMLPPFAKAKKQAEYLQALPASVQRYFPEVYSTLERDIPIPLHLRTNGKKVYKEFIYEMSYVPGEEVSRFIERYSPPPAVIARLYEQIFLILQKEVYAVNRIPAPGQTLDDSYFVKIEDRLSLCRRTAPLTFCAELLETDRIIINEVSYLNSSALLKRFREKPEFLDILEPKFHYLVMGDTNTENIKVADTAPLLRAQWLIEAGGASDEEIDASLDAITSESLGIQFLDPRAIGFKTDGAHTRDDAMYDNKPWHNSIGHYDEIHCEYFKLQVQTGRGLIPSVHIEFNLQNPFQKAYRIRDVEALGGKIDKAVAPKGMEDYFGPIMTTMYCQDGPDSQELKNDPYWLIRFVFIMGTHFAAMPPFHFQSELDGTLTDTYQAQRRPVAIYCEGIKWLNWALEMLEGKKKEFLGVLVPQLPYPLLPTLPLQSKCDCYGLKIPMPSLTTP